MNCFVTINVSIIYFKIAFLCKHNTNTDGATNKWNNIILPSLSKLKYFNFSSLIKCFGSSREFLGVYCRAVAYKLRETNRNCKENELSMKKSSCINEKGGVKSCRIVPDGVWQVGFVLRHLPVGRLMTHGRSLKRIKPGVNNPEGGWLVDQWPTVVVPALAFALRLKYTQVINSCIRIPWK